MKKVVKLAVVGIAAGLCLSGQKALPEKDETAMSNSTTSDAVKAGASNAESPKNTSQLEPAVGPKSAAQRVVDGTSNNSMNGKRKSAAQLATEK